MQPFERRYAELVSDVLAYGEQRQTRNAETLSMFGASLLVEINGTNILPLIQGRKMFPKGILGEFAAMVRRPTHIDDFKRWGCNYWDQWAKPDGSINVDYGNAWFDYNGVNQVAMLKHALRNNPTDRRMIINSWRPDKLQDLSLPCCHYDYQFYVSKGKYLHMKWTQRSVDLMVGLPSDILFAAVWLITLANEFGYTPGYIKIDMGDVHIYDAHVEEAEDYLAYCEENKGLTPVTYRYDAKVGKDFCLFDPKDLHIGNYVHGPKLDLELFS